MLIEETYRAVHILTMLYTERMGQQEFDELASPARNVMVETMNEGNPQPEPAVPASPSVPRAQRLWSVG